MLNWVWSSGPRARLSRTGKFTSHRRRYESSADIRGRISCCTEAPHCQSPERTPHPDSRVGSRVESNTGVPKLRLVFGPQTSIDPVVAGLCALVFRRSQSGTQLPLVSFHVRVALAEMGWGGWGRVNTPPFCAASR